MDKETSFVLDLTDDPLKALQEVSHRVYTHYSKYNASQSTLEAILESYLEAYAYITVSIDINNLNWDVPKLYGSNLNQARIIGEYFEVLCKSIDVEVSNQRLAHYKEKFSQSLGDTFTYEFPDEDFDRIQELINLLRDEIKQCELLEEEYRERLLKRLEKLQREFHKKMSNLDTFFGLVSDTAVAFGKAGKDIKPLVDRVREIIGIVVKIRNVCEGIPTNISLPFPELSEENEDEN